MTRCTLQGARPLVALAFLAFVTPAGRAAPPEYVLTSKPVHRVEAVETFDVTYPKVTATEWIAFAVAAPEVPSQQKVSTKLTPDGKAGTEGSDLKRPIVSTRVAAKDKQTSRLQFSATYQATLLERHLVPLAKGSTPPRVAPLTDAEKKWYLAATKTFYDYEAKPFQEWLDRHGLRKKTKEDEISFARRVLIVIADTCTYEARLDNDRHASAVCKSGKSDCGGMSVLFAAACRTNGIPARSLVGNWTESAKPGAVVGDIPFTQQHTRAEFFAAGVGWVPVDASAALAYKGKQAAMLDYCFGYDPGTFLVKLVDYDIVLDTGVYGKVTLPWTWCTAWPIGKGDQTSPELKSDWKVKQLPLK